jgi:hypothetical protein
MGKQGCRPSYYAAAETPNELRSSISELKQSFGGSSVIKYPGSKASYLKWIMSFFPSHKQSCKFSGFKKYGKSTANPESTAKCRKKSTAKVRQIRRVRQNAVKKVQQKYGKPEEYGNMTSKRFYNRLRGGG